MSRNPNNDLRNAMKNLGVNLPMKLKGAPSFQPPAEITEVPRKEAPQIQPTGNESVHFEAAKSRVASMAPTSLEAAQKELPDNEVPHIGKQPKARILSANENKLSQAEVTPIELARPKEPEIEPPQNQATEIEETQTPECSHLEEGQSERPQNRAAQVEEAESMPTGGFFKLSHNVFQESLLRNLSGDCFRLFLWLSARGWRYPTSIGEVRASVRFMEERTGMGHATISRSLKTLKEAGLITLLATDFKLGNLWRVSSLACGGQRGPDDFPPRSELPRKERAQKHQAPTSKRETSSLKVRSELPQSECNIRSIKKDKKISQEALVADCFFSDETRSDELRQTALRNFESELDNHTKDNFIKGYVEREFAHGFCPPHGVIRSLAAFEWFSVSNTENFQMRAASH